MKLLFSCLLIVVSTAVTFATDWQTDYKKALAQAHSQKRQVLLNFTGSDWCGWCMRLKKEVFDKPAFKDFADKNLILVELDYPSAKPQSQAVKKQNEALQKKYGIEGFPTLVLLDSDGKVLRKNVGYLKGGVEGFMHWIRQGK